MYFLVTIVTKEDKDTCRAGDGRFSRLDDMVYNRG
jgi:hypothetical protein